MPSSPTRTFSLQDIEEFAKCVNDPVYFIDRFVGLPFEAETIRTMHKNRFVLDRSTCLNGLFYLIHHACFQNNQHAALLGPTFARSKALLRVALDIMYKLPDHIKPAFSRDPNSWSVEFENGSQISAYGISSDATCGNSFSLIYADSFTHVKPEVADDFWCSVFPTISSGTRTKCFISEGLNPFTRLWNDTNNGFVKRMTSLPA